MASHPNKMSSTMPASNPYSGYRRKLAWGNHSMNQLTHGFSTVSKYRTTAERNTFPSSLAWGQGAGVVTRIRTGLSQPRARYVAKILLVLVSWVPQSNWKAWGGRRGAVTGLLEVIRLWVMQKRYECKCYLFSPKYCTVYLLNFVLAIYTTEEGRSYINFFYHNL